MANTSTIRRTFTDLTQEVQMRELNRQMDWIWHQLLNRTVSGEFTDANGKTITVANGLVTAIVEPQEEEP